MNTPTKKFLAGIGSVFSLMPTRDLRKLIPQRSLNERMASHFAHVGMSLTKAFDAFDQNDTRTQNKRR